MRHSVRELLPTAPCAALITSRIQQMAGVKDFALDHMEPEQARELFVNSLGGEAVQAEEKIIHQLALRCAYNPLALEIASKRIRQTQDKFTSPIAKYYEKVSRRFEELKMPGNQRWYMTAVFDQSYNDLTEADQAKFRALSVFAPTGFSPTAAAHIWGVDEAQAGQVLYRFINLSLVIAVKGDFERFRLHDLLDEYAAPKLRESGEEEKATSDLAEWLVQLFGEHYTDDFSNAPEVGLEFANLAKTAEWAIEKQKGVLLALLATKPRNWLLTYFRELADWLRWLETSLKINFDDNQLKANVLQAIGDVLQFRKELDAALVSYNEALKLFKEIGAKLGEANVYLSLGGAKRENKDFAGARIDFTNALKVYQIIGDQYSQARALYRLGDCLSDEKKYQDAIAEYEKAIQLWTAIGVTDLVEGILKPRLEEAKKHL